MFVESFRYLAESDDVVKTVAIGGVLTLFGALILPAFGVLGYVVRVLDRTSTGDDEPPVFDEWGDLLVDGAKAFVIAFVYGLVPSIVGGVVLALGFGLGAAGESGALGALGILLGGVVWFVLAVAAAYVVPAALANYADHRTVGAGFALGTLRTALLSRTYAVGWGYALAVLVVGGAVASLLNGIPILGTVVGAFVGFYALVAAYYVIGHTWADLHAVEVAEDEFADEGMAI